MTKKFGLMLLFMGHMAHASQPAAAAAASSDVSEQEISLAGSAEDEIFVRELKEMMAQLLKDFKQIKKDWSSLVDQEKKNGLDAVVYLREALRIEHQNFAVACKDMKEIREMQRAAYEHLCEMRTSLVSERDASRGYRVTTNRMQQALESEITLSACRLGQMKQDQTREWTEQMRPMRGQFSVQPYALGLSAFVVGSVVTAAIMNQKKS